MFMIGFRYGILVLSPLFAFSAAAQTSSPQPSSAQIEAARVAQLRLLCVTLSGGDLTDPLDQLKFQRCLKNPPQQAMRENLQPPRAAINPYANLVSGPQALVVSPAPRHATPGQTDICAQGYVWREAAAQDHVCVTPLVRNQTAHDNGVAARHKRIGSDVCGTGFVWREAFAGDHVCVSPAAHAQAAADNRQALSRLVQN
jgi:hypothetical protein